MEEKIVDARGKACPEPLIMTKKAIKDLAPGQKMRVIVDNETAKNNVERFLADHKMPAHCTEQGGVFFLHVNKSGVEPPDIDPAGYCSTGATVNGTAAIMIGSDKMGDGPDELGAILIKAFVNTIKETTPLPKKIIFYNSGILLATEGSPLVATLNELEKSGVAILVCGTCVNYFNKQNLIRAGTISNMYTILEALNEADRIIKP